MISYVIRGRRRQCVRGCEVAARRREQEILAEIAAVAKQRTNRASPDTCETAGEDGDWRRLLWMHAQRVSQDPLDELAQKALIALSSAARADLAIRRSQKDEISDDEARKLLSDPDIAAKLDAVLHRGNSA